MIFEQFLILSFSMGSFVTKFVCATNKQLCLSIGSFREVSFFTRRGGFGNFLSFVNF